MATVATDRRPRTAGGPPLRRGSGRAVLDGNELIVKGALEAGVSLVTGYPGSPVAEVFSICEAHAPYLAELGVEAQLANNEAQSAAMLNGARQVPGARGMAVMKSVGAYVALDGLAIANAALPAAGAAAVVVVGDDPALSLTQVGADSRLTLAGARMPVLEPASRPGAEGPRAARLRPLGRERAGGRPGLHDASGRRRRHRRAGPEPGPGGRPPAARGPRHRGRAPGRHGVVAAASNFPGGGHHRAAGAAPARGRPRRRPRPDRAAGRARARAGGRRDRRGVVRAAALGAGRAGDRRARAGAAPGAHLADRPAPGATLRRRGGRAGGDGGAGAAPRGSGAARGRGATAGGVGEAPAGRGPRVPRGRGDGSRHRPGGPRAAGAGAAGRLPARGRRARPRRRRARARRSPRARSR